MIIPHLGFCVYGFIQDLLNINIGKRSLYSKLVD